MLNRWKKRIKNLFGDEEEIEKNYSSNQSIQTRVTYQYPNNSRFNFPVIPDQKLETPAYLRKNEFDRRQDNQVRQNRLNINKTNQVKEPFKPSQVASPIYGYQPRKVKRKIEKVPAYVRQKKAHSNSNNQLKMDPLKENEKSRQFSKSKMEKKNQSVKDNNKGSEDTVENIHTKKVTKQRIKEISNHSSLHKRNQPKTIPFNVIMTPRDKKKLRDQKKLLKEKSQQDMRFNQTNQYKLPFHLLNDMKQSNHEDKLWIQQQQKLLEKTLKHFKVRARVVNVTQGPSVTRFEIQPELGVKVSKIRNLSDDIKLNMAAKDIRIEAPIPGKHTIGIEVPNQERQSVGLRQILQTSLFKQTPNPLTVGLGLDVEGRPFITNIAKMPHGLIAGATGSGKSVCINTILISLLYQASYENVKLLLIDPKMVELAPYNGIPHLLSPVITDVKAATAALKWAVNEMEERYESFVREGVRSIERYNEKMNRENRLDEKMPFIVIVIDELADLMMVAPQDVEDAISRIAQKARACGMHLLLATQRPSVDVITGLIKANIPTRIAFSVSSQIDSRTIIDMNGAERLLGRGDMLFIENGSGKARRLQGAFVSDEEIDRVTDYVRKMAAPTYLFEQEQLVKKMEIKENEDDLLDEVINFVSEQTNVSISLLQRHFRIGYNRAARIIDTLETKGIISGQNGSKPRDVLLSKSELENIVVSKAEH